MKRAEVRQVVRVDDDLYEVIAIAEGRTVILGPVNKNPCPTCGSQHRIEWLEHSPLFQENVKPVKTL